jgi:hypothetical protein
MAEDENAFPPRAAIVRIILACVESDDKRIESINS